MSGLPQNWVRLDPNETNLLLFKIISKLSEWQWQFKKKHFWQIFDIQMAIFQRVRSVPGLPDVPPNSTALVPNGKNFGLFSTFLALQPGQFVTIWKPMVYGQPALVACWPLIAPTVYPH